MKRSQALMHFSAKCPIGQVYRKRWTGVLLLVAILLWQLPTSICAQDMHMNVGTNLLYWATTTPNLRVEWHLKERYTLSTTWGYSTIKFSSDSGKNPKLFNFVCYPEVKYWFCHAFERDYVGVHAFYGRYNAGGIGLVSFLDSHRYQGYGLGIGVSYGYQWALGRRWGFEASFGIGYIYLNYRKYELGKRGELLAKGHRHNFLPTKCSLSVLYFVR